MVEVGRDLYGSPSQPPVTSVTTSGWASLRESPWPVLPPEMLWQTTGSPNHRMAGVGRDLRRLASPASLLKQGPLEEVARDPMKMAFERLQGLRFHSLSGQPLAVLWHPHTRKVVPSVQTQFPLFSLVPAASRPTTGQHRRGPGAILFTPYPQLFFSTDKIPPISLRSSRLHRPSSPSLSSQQRCSSPFLILVALCCTHSTSFIYLVLYCGAPNCTQHTRAGFSRAEERGRITSLDLLARLCSS